MRFMGRACAITLTGGLCLGTLLLPAGAVQADTSATLPISGFYQMAVDVAGGHIFLSQGTAAQGVVVTDLSGQNATTIQGTGTDTVMGIAISPDGSTLYAAVSSADEVIAISTSSLTQTATYSLGTGNSPRDV